MKNTTPKKPKKIKLPVTVSAFGVRQGYPVSRDAANRVGPILVRLLKGKSYSPAALVDAARDPRSPAHRDFEWDDTVAGEKWRVEQAKLYQRAIVYDVIVSGEGGKKSVEMRVVHPIDYSSKTRYASGSDVLHDEGLALHVLARAEAALGSWRDQYAALKNAMKLAGVFKAIDEALGPRAPSARKRSRR